MTSCDASKSFYNSSLGDAKAKLDKKESDKLRKLKAELDETLEKLAVTEHKRQMLLMKMPPKMQAVKGSINTSSDINNKMKEKWAEYFKYSLTSKDQCFSNNGCQQS